MILQHICQQIITKCFIAIDCSIHPNLIQTINNIYQHKLSDVICIEELCIVEENDARFYPDFYVFVVRRTSCSKT